MISAGLKKKNMARKQSENTNRLSVFFLKKHGYLPQGESSRYGEIRWSRGEDWENNMNFVVSINNHEDVLAEIGYVGDIELIYTVTVHYSGEKTDMRYKIPLVATPCNYGGRRYWFECSLFRNGMRCGRRVGVIYSIDKWFGCRDCAGVAYQKQFESGKCRWNGISIPYIEKAEDEVKRYYYNGKPTRKHRRLMRLNEKFENNFRMMATHLTRRSR